MDNYRAQEYNEFILKNREKVNKYLNRTLWIFTITGPAVALGVKTAHFHDISYATCLYISLVVIGMSLILFVMRKKMPRSAITGLFALTALNVLIGYMNIAHINIYITWFLVPMLSILFCDKFVYFYSLIFNYVLMICVTWITAPYYEKISADYDTVKACFIDRVGGFTIETIIMLAGSYMILKLEINHFKELFRQQALIKSHEESMEEKMNILDSMAEIYDNVNLVDFVNGTEMSIRNSNQKKYGIDLENQTHTFMNQNLKEKIVADQLEDFLTFTNIKTVQARLLNKKIISADFIDTTEGWIRAQYITAETTKEGLPTLVIYTTRNVDEEKRREEHLIRISMTDELTRLFNRRCYEEDLEAWKENGLTENFVMLSIDINGLKKVNDTKGHAAGDELIKGAATCIAYSVGSTGRAYRTGGDEFMAIVNTDNPEKICKEIHEKAEQWNGVYTDELSLSVGYATCKDCEGEPDVDKLEHIADSAMYVEKEKYYAEKGIERRK